MYSGDREKVTSLYIRPHARLRWLSSRVQCTVAGLQSCLVYARPMHLHSIREIHAHSDYMRGECDVSWLDALMTTPVQLHVVEYNRVNHRKSRLLGQRCIPVLRPLLQTWLHR